MGKMSQRETADPELEKILSKAFEDIQRRVTTMIVRREKKLVKALSQKPRKDRTERTDRQEKTDRAERQERTERKRKEKEPERSRSVSEESE